MRTAGIEAETYMSRGAGLRKQMAYSVLIKGGGFVISLILIRIYLQYFASSDVLGVWFTMLAMLNWIVTFDFGVGNGLRNRLVEALATGDRVTQRELISTTYALSAVVAIVAFTLATGAAVFLDWNGLLRVSHSLLGSSYLETGVLVVAAGVCLQLVLKNVNSVLFALQMPSASNATGLITNAMLLVCMIVLRPNGDEAGIVLLASLYLVCSVVPLAMFTFWLFAGRLRDVRPSPRHVKRSAAAKVLQLGAGFFTLQILSLVLFNTSEIMITRTTTPSSVVEFQMYNRLYNGLAMFVWIALVPMWSAVSKAYYEGDIEWIGRAYRKLRSYVPAVVVLLLLLTASLQVIFNVWLGEHAIAANYWYGLAFTSYYSLYVWWGVLASFANGTGKIGTQLVCAGLGACAYLVTAIVGVSATGLWIAVVWAGALGMLAYAVLEPRNIRRLTGSLRNAPAAS